MESIELKIEQQVSRLCALCGPQDRRARKRVLQTIGKLKRRLSETHSSEVTNELQTSTSKELVIEQPAQLSKKHLKAKLKLLNDELAGLARKKMAQIAVKKLRAAVRRGIPVDVHSYTNVLHAFVRCNDMQEALRLADEMESVGIPPNNVTYTALLKGYCEQHDVQGALHFIRRVRVDVNTRVANTLLRGCMRTGDMLLATKIIRKIYGEWNVVKDESTVEYSVALLCQGLCLADGEAAAQAPLVSTVTSLSDSSLHPSKTTNCAVYTCLCRAALLLCEWKTAALYLECAQQLQLATKTATLRQSMLKRSRDSVGACEQLSRSTDLFLRHKHDESGHELKMLGAYLFSRNDHNFEADVSSLMNALNCICRVIHFKKEIKSSTLSDGGDSISIVDEVNMSIFYHCRRSYGLSAVLRKLRALSGKDELNTDVVYRKVLRSIENYRNYQASKPVINLGAIFSSVLLSNSFFETKISTNVPLKLEIGSGSGEWVCAQARHDTELANWVALELRSDRCHHTLSRAIFNGIPNLSILCGDAVAIMSTWFPSHSVSAIYINHPQPPEHIDRGKTEVFQNQGKHLLTSDFFKLLHNSLIPGGTLTIVTDNQSYGRMLLRIVSDSSSSIFFSGDIENRSDMIEDFSIIPAIAYPVVDSESSGAKISEPCIKDKFILWRGEPDDAVGHKAQSSSYFDRMWDKGQHSRRWILYLVAR